MDVIKHLTVTSLIWKLLERGGSAVVQMLVQVVMARLLAPEEFGALAIILVFVNLGNVIVQSGLNTALIQSPEVSDEDYSTVFWMSTTFSLVLFVVIFVSAPAVSSFYAMPRLVWPLRVLAFVLVINAYNAVQVAAITRELQMKKVFRATIVSVLCSAVFGISCALLGFGLWALVIQQIVNQLSNCAALAFQLSWKPRFVFNASRAKRLFSFGWKLMLSSMLDNIYQSTSDLVIGKMFSATALGLVSQGKKYPNAIGSMLDGAIQPVMLSAVSHVQDDTLKVKRMVSRALKTSTFLVIPTMSLFALLAPTLIPLLLGDQWIESVPFLQIYCIVYAMIPIHTTNLQALNGMGRSDLFLKLELVKKVYGFAWIMYASLVVRDIYFLIGGYVITGIISTIVNAWPNKRLIGYAYLEQLLDIAPSVFLTFGACIGGGALGYLPLGPIGLIVCQVLAFIVIYLGLAKLFRVEEFKYLVNTAKELFSVR